MSASEAPVCLLPEVPDSGPLFSSSFHVFSFPFPFWNNPVKDLTAVSGYKVLTLLPCLWVIKLHSPVFYRATCWLGWVCHWGRHVWVWAGCPQVTFFQFPLLASQLHWGVLERLLLAFLGLIWGNTLPSFLFPLIYDKVMEEHIGVQRPEATHPGSYRWKPRARFLRE